MKFEKNVEIFSGISENSIDFLKTFLGDERLSPWIRKSLAEKLQLINDLLKVSKLGKSNEQIAGTIISVSNNVQFGLGRFSALLAIEVSNFDLKASVNVVAAFEMISCYITVNLIVNGQ